MTLIEGAHPIRIMIDTEAEIIVHGGDRQTVLQVFGEETFVHHVVVQRIVQFNVHIADEGSSGFLNSEKEQEFESHLYL